MKEWEKLTIAIVTMILVGAYFWGAYDAQRIRENRIRMQYTSGVLDEKQYAQAVHKYTYIEMIYRPSDVLRHLKRCLKLDRF